MNKRFPFILIVLKEWVAETWIHLAWEHLPPESLRQRSGYFKNRRPLRHNGPIFSYRMRLSQRLEWTEIFQYIFAKTPSDIRNESLG